MDNRSFISRLAKATGNDTRRAAQFVEAMAHELGNAISQGDNVALPGFGTFNSVKTDEHTVTDTDSDAVMLMPPHVDITFAPASHLKKKMP